MTSKSHDPWELDERPAHSLTLTDEELAQLGRHIAVCGQIDFYIFLTVAVVLNTSNRGIGVVLETATTGVRVGYLRKMITLIPSPEAAALTKTFCEMMGPVIENRNAAIHGVWGLHLDHSSKSSANSVYHPRVKNKKIDASNLPSLLKDASKASRTIYRMHRMLLHDPLDYQEDLFPSVFGGNRPENTP